MPGGRAFAITILAVSSCISCTPPVGSHPGGSGPDAGPLDDGPLDVPFPAMCPSPPPLVPEHLRGWEPHITSAEAGGRPLRRDPEMRRCDRTRKPLVAPAGSDVSLTLNLQNEGEDAFTNVRVGLAVQRATFDVPSKRSLIGRFPSGTQRSVTLSFRIAEARCSSDALMSLVVEAAEGARTIPLDVRVACPGLHLHPMRIDFSGGDGDHIPEPGERVTMTVWAYNLGRDPVEGVRAGVSFGAGEREVRRARWSLVRPLRAARSIRGVVLVIPPTAPADTCGGSALGFGTLTFEADGAQGAYTGLLSPGTACRL